MESFIGIIVGVVIIIVVGICIKCFADNYDVEEAQEKFVKNQKNLRAKRKSKK